MEELYLSLRCAPRLRCAALCCLLLRCVSQPMYPAKRTETVGARFSQNLDTQ